jgi:hypothetical protein
MRGAICAIFIVILSENYNGNDLLYAWFRGQNSRFRLSALFGAYHVIWRRPGQIAAAVDDATYLYFGIAARQHVADVSLVAPDVRIRG